jgi:hypothetical protein
MASGESPSRFLEGEAGAEASPGFGTAGVALPASLARHQRPGVMRLQRAMEVESQAVEAKQETHGGVVRGLEELEVLFSEVKTRFLRYSLFCIVVSLTWPFLLAAVVVFGPFVYLVSPPEGRRRFMDYLLAGCGIVFLFLLYFGIPVLFLMGQHHGMVDFLTMLKSGEITTIELCFHFFSFLMLLMIVVFAWVVYGATSLEVAIALNSRARFLCKHWRQEVNITEAEREAVFGKVGGDPVHIEDLLALLEKYPGWKGSFEANTEDLDALVTIRSSGRRTSSARYHAEKRASRDHALHRTRSSQRMKHIDAIVLSSSEVLAPGDSIAVFKAKVLCFLKDLLLQPLGTMLLCLLWGITRATIPRVWVLFTMDDAEFLPGNPVEKTVTLTFMWTTFLAATAWLLLFNLAQRRYNHNIEQMLLVTAIVSVQKRHQYMRTVLRIDPEDTEHILLAKGLPFLDISDPDNTRIWWAIREYAIVDSLDERVDLEIVLGVVLFYTTTMSLYLIVDVVLSGRPTAFTAVALFDLVIIGSMVLSSLFSCVQVNELLRSHTHTFLRARHSLWCPESKVLGMADNEIGELLDVDDAVAMAAFSPGASAGLKDSQRLHTHLIEKIEHSDTLQTIFGVEVTMDNIGQLVVAIGCGIGSATFSIKRAQKKLTKNARKHVTKAREAAQKVTKATRLLALRRGHIDAAAALPALNLASRVIGAVQRVDAIQPQFLAPNPH